MEGLGILDNPHEKDDEVALELFKILSSRTMDDTESSGHGRTGALFCLLTTKWLTLDWRQSTASFNNHLSCLRILWLKDIHKPLGAGNLQVYRFQRVPFGVISSPFLLAATIQHHLKQHPSPLSSEIVDNTYVDNIQMLAMNPTEAVEKYHQSKNLFRMAQMNVREYISNCPDVNEAIPSEDRLLKRNPKVLGVKWDNVEDNLHICFPTSKRESVLTRRKVLQEMASMFDPLGWQLHAWLKQGIFSDTME
uniref:Reverse transcriptase domain-containing protein n=1 Tax=Ditylenchus dipsaci TaxID=166011 RepID=A0A915DHN4_9BILA